MNVYLNKENGSALIMTMLVLVVLSMLGAAALNSTDSELGLARAKLNELVALSLAESGLEHGKQYVQENMDELDSKLQEFENNPEDMEIVEKPIADEPDKVYTLTLEQDAEDSDIFYIVSKGEYKDKEVDLRLEIDRGLSLNLDGTFSIYTPDPSMDMKDNNMHISGLDYEVPFNFNCSGVGKGANSCSRTVSDYDTNLPPLFSSDDLDNPANKDNQLEYNEDEIDDPVKTGDSALGNTNDSWLKFIDNVVKAVSDENTITGDPDIPGNGELGTRANPEMFVIKKDDDDDDPPELTGTIDGAGILVVQDGAKITGNFHFEGLVLFDTREATEDPEVFSTGASTIFGGAVVAGDQSFEDIAYKGKSSIVYSKEALELAENVGSGMDSALTILSWDRL